MCFKKRLVCLCFILCCFALNAQYTPFFQNYVLSEFGAGNKNWGVSQAENGKIYVANDKGLVEFNGMTWNFYQLPNKTIIRSVMAHKDIVYTGSYEEFGYWKKNSKGRLDYTSLDYFKEDNGALDEEFWQIFEHDGTILFRSFSNLYILKNDKIKRIKPESTIMSCSVVDGKVYVATIRSGVFILEENALVPFIGEQALYNVKVVSMNKFNDKLLLTTALNGCYLYNEGRLEPWQSEITNVIKEQQLNSFLLLKNNDMVFGTIKNGVYITDSLGNIKYHVNKENGLLNNTVLSQELGVYDQLWIGLDNGIASIDLNSNNVLYNDKTGKLGAVYDVISFNDKLYIGSNTGLFYLDDTDHELKFIEGSQGQVWDLKQINNQLFCGHNNGTYLVENDKLKKIASFTGGWVIKKVPERSDTYIQGTYGGLVRFDWTKGKWSASHLGGNTIPVKYFVFEDPHTIWAAHAYKGLFRVKLSKNYDSILQFQDYKPKGLWSDYNVKVHKIKNDICFKTNKGWQKYEALLDSIIPNDILNASFGAETDIISESDTDVLVTKNGNNKISFVSLIDDEKHLWLPNKSLQKRLVVDAESVSRLNDTLYTLNLYDGFMLINKNVEKRNDTLQMPVLEQIEVANKLMDINNGNKYEFPFNDKISVSVSAPLSSNYFFEYAIANTTDTLSWYKMDNGKLELSNLSNGEYKIHFRTVNFSRENTPIKTIQFRILPPWYKNTMFYLMVLVFASALFYWLHRRKIRKEQLLLEKKLVEEQEILLKEKAIENDKKLVELKNQSLKSEVKLKSKQLANTAMALVKKNETMQEIKGELEKHKSDFKNALSYKRLLRKINNSIGHEDEWELFEYNFNQVHEDFFNQLKAEHPTLTHKDLKICAYIKMNLLTKEIAPLMNVSIRGLETHRYRLKRKLNLENDKSLADYLRNYK